jgi:hypothetical protein
MEALPRAVDERGRDILNQMENLANAMEDRMVAMHHELAAGVESRAAEVSSQVTATAMAAVDSALEPRLASLRAALEERNHEIAALRRLLEDSDGRALELLLAIGEACRQTAQRMGPAEASAAVPSPPKETSPAPEPAAPQAEADLPGFAQSKPPGRILKLPLVSSLVVTLGLGGMVLLRML